MRKLGDGATVAATFTDAVLTWGNMAGSNSDERGMLTNEETKIFFSLRITNHEL